MYVILLRFAENRDRAKAHLQAHKAWLKQGFDDGVFLLAGSLRPDLGGAILAGDIPRPQIEARVAADPFVAEAVVSAEILDLAPAMAAPALAALLPAQDTAPTSAPTSAPASGPAGGTAP